MSSQAQRIEFTSTEPQFAGMGNFVLVSPDCQHEIELIYEGEPPHGDSYHLALIDGRPYRGYVWGCMFAFSSCSRYVAFSAMPTKFERRTAVVDLVCKTYFMLPKYIYQFRVDWPRIVGDGRLDAGAVFEFNGREVWTKI